jgi:hypothetical protein
MRGTPASHLNYPELQAELDRRLTLRQMAAATAQVRAAWYQLAAVIAMLLTLIATVANKA